MPLSPASVSTELRDLAADVIRQRNQATHLKTIFFITENLKELLENEKHSRPQPNHQRPRQKQSP